jgi:AcrR family transcriptional regulator
MVRRSKAAPNAESAARRRIVEAARRQFFAHGLRSVTMDDLAESLGMSKKTLYAHFPGKTALLEALLADKFRRIEADLARIPSGRSADVLPALRQLLATVQAHAQEIQPAFLRDVQRQTPEIYELAERRRRKVLERHFGRLLSAGRRSGVVRADVPVGLVVEVLLASAHGLLNEDALQRLGLTPAKGLTCIITVILEGVLTAKGRSKR